MKLKVKIKDFRLRVRGKISSKEKINTKELELLSNTNMRGFLKVKLVRKKHLEYEGPVGISLKKRLQAPFSKYEFLLVMAQIIEAARKICLNNLSMCNLLLDFDYIFINEMTREIQFIYMPIVIEKVDVNIIEFMETIIYSVKTLPNQNSDYISKYAFFIKGLASYDASAIERYIGQEDINIINQIKNVHGRQSGFMADKLKNKREDDDDATALLYEDDEATGLLYEDENEATSLLYEEDDEATGLLIENDDEGTSLLMEEELASKIGKHYPRLVRLLTNETIIIDKPVFRIGKEQSYVDYFVANNSSVSRSHLDIISRGTNYFVIDLNSKNHTYINGKEIQAQNETQIFDGDEVKIANEEFVFNI